MKFWDTSALVPMLVSEDTTVDVTALYRADPVLAVVWTTPVECASALARAEREGLLAPDQVTVGFARLDALARAWIEVEPIGDLRDIARRLLRVHPLRAADAIQLAAATVAAEQRPASLTIVTLDQRIEVAALKEGFHVVVPGRTR